MRSPDGRGQPRGALVLNSPMSDCRETHPSAKGSSAEGNSTMMPLSVKLRWATRKVCVSVCVCVCVCACVRQTDSAGRLNESYNVNQAQSN